MSYAYGLNITQKRLWYLATLKVDNIIGNLSDKIQKHHNQFFNSVQSWSDTLLVSKKTRESAESQISITKRNKSARCNMYSKSLE
jgi:hypothetical protein